VHGVALAVGLSALLVASATAYTAVKLAGAAYLCWLGVQTLRAARRGATTAATDRASPVQSRRRAFMYGLISTVLNPKPALFFLTLVPQFIDEQRTVLPQVAFLVAIHVIVGLVWLTFYARLVHRAHRMLTRADVRRWLEGLTGTVLIALGSASRLSAGSRRANSSGPRLASPQTSAATYILAPAAVSVPADGWRARPKSSMRS
jgi:threonine/homoserine/homoserine lactone efflux protein